MGVVCSLLFASVGSADEPNRYQANIDKGRSYLSARMKEEKRIGYLGLGVMALLKTAPHETEGPSKGRPKKTPELQRLVDRFVQSLEVEDFKDSEGTYAIAVAVSCLVADDPTRHERTIRRLVGQIIADQKPNGSWAYPGGSPVNGDTSQVQYIALALWDAASVGIKIPPRVWDSVLDWQIRTQDAAGAGGPGGFVYHPSKISEDGNPVDQGNEIATMGVAGLSTMLICQRQLPNLRTARDGKKAAAFDELVRPAADDPNEQPFVPRVTDVLAQAAIERAEAWVARNSAFQGPYQDRPKINYYLYGFERVAALLNAKGAKSPVTSGDWYRAGGDFLARLQKPDGSWSMGAHWPEAADTAFALMFLGRATEIAIGGPRIEMLKRGHAIGGEGGLPAANGADGITAFQRQYERYKDQPKADVDELVKILEDPDRIVAEETAKDAERLTPEQIKKVVEKAAADPKKLRRWAYDKRPEARRIALTLLGKSREAKFAPILIDALKDKDADVYTAARDGLRYVSRNVETFGLPTADKRTPDAVEKGIERAQAWFRALDIETPPEQEFTPPRNP
jgi:hypothetical protein